MDTFPPIPERTRTLCAPSFGPPSKWEILELPTPKIERSDEVLIRVHAASINPTDVGGALGRYWPAFSVPLPYKIGYDLAGTVVSIGSEVNKVKVGDEVFCCLGFKDRGRFGTGSISEYAVVSETLVVSKPKNLNFVEAASIPLVALTAIQMFDRVPGGVEGKKVFVSAGLSGVGSIAAQMAKNVYRAERVITTVSTAKVDMVDRTFGKGVVDEIIDYTKVNPSKTIPRHSVDVMIDSIGASFSAVPILKRNGMIMACAGPPPSGHNLKIISNDVPFFVQVILNLVDTIIKWWFWRSQINFDSVLMKSDGKDLEKIKGWVEEERIRPTVGKILKFGNLEGIKEEGMRIMKGNGGVGKVVVSIIMD